MIRKRLISLGSAVLMGVGVVAAVGSPAHAHEVNYTVDVDWSTKHDKDCTGPPEDATACVQPYGDIIWIKDGRKNGHGVRVSWYEYGTERTGTCINNQGADAAWTWCNKDFSENHDLRWTLHYHDKNGKETSIGYMYTRM